MSIDQDFKIVRIRKEDSMEEHKEYSLGGSVERKLSTGQQLDELLYNEDNDGRTALHEAAEAGHIVALESMRDSTTPSEWLKRVCRKDKFGRTAVHEAAGAGHLRVIETIRDSIKRSEWLALLCDEDYNGRTALHEAAEYEHIDALESIRDSITPSEWLKRVCSKDKSGRTAVHEGAELGHSKVLENIRKSIPADEWLRLLLITDNSGRTAVHEAAEAGHVELIEDISQRVQPSDWLTLLHTRDNNSRTALHESAEGGHSSVIESIKGSVSQSEWLNLLNLKDKWNSTPFNLAPNSETKDNLVSKQESFYLGRPPTLLIFYNAADRDGAEEEMLSIARAFDLIGVSPSIHKDFTGEMLLAEVNSACDQEHLSALIVITMSHGLKGSLEDVNRQPLDIQQILVALSEPKLEGLPKVLIMQACRSPYSFCSSRNPTTSLSPASTSSTDVRMGNADAGVVGQIQDTFHITQRDFLVVCSTLHGCPAERGLFITLLAEQIKESKEDFISIITAVNKEVVRRSNQVPSQVPILQSTLSKKLYIKRFISKKS